MQEIRCPSCTFLMGFSEHAITRNGLLCHYCTIEREYFRHIFNQEDGHNESDQSPFENYAKWRADPKVQTGAFYEAQSRENQLAELLSFIPKLLWKCDKKDDDK